MFTLKHVMLIVLLGVGSSAVPQEEVRQADHNRVVLELPSFNFTRLYNDINLGRLYNRLFNTTRDKEKEDVPVDSPKESLEQVQPIVTQTVGLPVLQHGYQYMNTPQLINGFNNPSLVIAQRNGLANIISSQTPNILTNFQLSEATAAANGRQLGYGYELGHGHGYGQGYGQGHGPGFGYGYGPGYGNFYGSSFGSPYPEYSLINSLSNANRIPGLKVQELPYSALNEAYFNLIRNQYYRNGYYRPGYFGGRQFPPARFGQRISSQVFADQEFEPEENDSFGLDENDEYYNDEVDNYGDENGAEYDEGDGYDDEFGDGDELWRKANAETKTKTKTKQRKSNKRLKRRQEQQLESKQRSKRITY